MSLRRYNTRSHMFSSLFLCLYAVIILDLTCFRAYFTRYNTRSHMFSSLFLCLYAVIILDLTFRAYFYALSYSLLQYSVSHVLQPISMPYTLL